jgi:hypothetical protein
MNITPIRETGPSRTGTLNASYDQIVEKVGPPNVTDMDDPIKVAASWGFEDDQGRKAYIWSYKYYGDIEECFCWSTDGDQSLLQELFGKNFQ